MTAPNWLFLEPYYGGSHRHLVDGLLERLPIAAKLLTLPPRTWKWRMRGAALSFSRLLTDDPVSWSETSGIFTSSLLDAAALRGLLPRAMAEVPLVLYCHENQLRYPVVVEDKRDYHFGWTNIQSLVASDLILWNSTYNRDSFLEELPLFLRRLPDSRPEGLGDLIAKRSRILPVPFDAAGIIERTRDLPPRRGPCRILWNHRWEHDKAPEVFFGALENLAAEGLDFQISVLGQAFERRPEVFARARELLGSRIVAWGFLDDRRAYEREMAHCDVAVSTARHEFQGLAVLEAAAAGAVPLVPDDLSYPEIWPADLRYPRGGLVAALKSRIAGLSAWRERYCRETALRFDWSALLPVWQEVFGPSTPA